MVAACRNVRRAASAWMRQRTSKVQQQRQQRTHFKGSEAAQNISIYFSCAADAAGWLARVDGTKENIKEKAPLSYTTFLNYSHIHAHTTARPRSIRSLSARSHIYVYHHHHRHRPGVVVVLFLRLPAKFWRKSKSMQVVVVVVGAST